MSFAQKPVQGVKLLGHTAGAKIRHWKHIQRYGKLAPEPYEILHIDPTDITFCTLPSLMTQRSISEYGSHVVSGDWDRLPVYEDIWYTREFDEPLRAAFKDHALYRSMKAHFCSGVPWNETDWYQWIQANPGTVGQYPTQEAMDRRLAQVDTLFEQIRDDGYRSQRQLITDNSAQTPLYKQPLPLPEHHEIDINIGRDGELLFNFNGRHRLAVAKIVGLDQIPVRVFARHDRWQKRRLNGDVPAEHPDAQ